MKKTVAIMLSLLLTFSCVFSVSSAAAATTAAEISKSLNISETIADKSLDSSLEDLISCPQILSVNEEYPGVRVTWTRINGAAKYRLYARTDKNSEWQEVTDTTDESAIHVPEKSDTEYYYTVRAIDSQGVECVGYDSFSSSIHYIAAPELLSATASKNGIKVKWSDVAGVNLYRLFYKVGKESTWTKLTDTKETEFNHKDFVKDTEYTYTVRCLSDDGSEYISTFDDKGIKSELLNTPYVQSCEPVKGGVKITWKPVEGADKYRVFTKAGDFFAELGETSSTEYVHTGTVNNTEYVYTVRALSRDGRSYTSEFDKTGYEYLYLEEPKLTEINDTLKGPAISWEKVEGAKKYQVFVSIDGGKWQTDGSMITGDNVYTYTTAEYGHRFRFTVKCVDEKGQFISYHDTEGLSALYLEPPKLSATYNGDNVSLSWPAIKGAEGYILFAKDSDQDQFKVVDRTKDTKSVYYPGSSNYTMQFALRCLDKDGNFASAYRKACIVTSYLVETGVPDPNYSTICIELSDKDRDLAERICYGEAGSLGFTGMALVAQAVRDTYLKEGYTSIAEVLKNYGYDGSTDTPGNQEAKDAVKYIFDNGGAAVQHRILVFYASDLVKSSFHESQNYICSCGAVKFFDFW